LPRSGYLWITSNVKFDVLWVSDNTDDVGFWSNIFGRPVASVGIQSPYAPPSDFEAFALSEIVGELSAAGVLTREIALRVPGVKRAHGIHTALAGGLPFFLMEGDVRAPEQPRWLTTSDSGMSPLHRTKGIVSDLFMYGWACVGFTEDMSDCIYVPYGLWGIDATGAVNIAEGIPAAYRARPVAIPLGYGENGILVDGQDTIRAARLIEKAWNERIENPIPATELHITDPQYDNMSRKAKLKIVDQWNENRRRNGGQTALTQSFLEVKALGQLSPDLFEKGRNAVRLDIANHAAVPASIIEGSKDSGGSDINYSSDASKRNELYDFGTKTFVQAIEARFSLDDVCAPGFSVRADLTNLMAIPSPNSNPTSAD
jgi:hypothetical protein